MLNWKATSFPRSDVHEALLADPIATHSGPHGFTRIVVTRHIDFPGQWVLRCFGIFHIEHMTLQSVDIDNAKKEATKLLLSLLKTLVKEIQSK